jgi:septal ring factor EnvC (AmiA/AmiB activator)
MPPSSDQPFLVSKPSAASAAAPPAQAPGSAELVQQTAEALASLAHELVRLTGSSAQSAELGRALADSLARLETSARTLADAARSLEAHQKQLVRAVQELDSAHRSVERQQQQLRELLQRRENVLERVVMWAGVFAAVSVVAGAMSLALLILR